MNRLRSLYNEVSGDPMIQKVEIITVSMFLQVNFFYITHGYFSFKPSDVLRGSFCFPCFINRLGTHGFCDWSGLTFKLTNRSQFKGYKVSVMQDEQAQEI